MKKQSQPGDMFNAFVAKKKMTQKQDDAYDRKHGIKEGSKEDIKQDAKNGIKDKKHKKTMCKKHKKSMCKTCGKKK